LAPWFLASLPPCFPAPQSALHNLFVPKHLETKLLPRKNPPLSNSFRICDFLVPQSSRPNPPLSKSFVFNTVIKTTQKVPLSKSFGLNHLQTSCKAPLSKSFRITLLQKIYFFGFTPIESSRFANAQPTHVSAYYCRDKQKFAVVNQGQKPKNEGCGGWILLGNYRIGSGYNLTFNTGPNGTYTATQNYPTASMGGGRTQTGNFPRAEVFGGLNYFLEHYSNATATTNYNYLGFDTSVAYNPSKYVGIVGEFGGLYQLGVAAPPLGGTSESTNLYTFMGGAQFNCWKGRTFNPFAQALFGDVYARDTITVNGTSGITSSTTSSNGFGMQLGVGVDWNISRHVAVRPFQVNYFMTDFGGTIGHNFTYQGGIVYKF